MGIKKFIIGILVKILKSFIADKVYNQIKRLIKKSHYGRQIFRHQIRCDDKR